MTKDEVLKLALKTLEYAGPSWIDARQPAITAIKQALANEALEKMAENARELGLDYEPAQRTWVGLDWLPEHKCGLHLSHNEHRDVYETIEQFYDSEDFISSEEWHKSVAKDSVWVLHWYPETPIGFIRIAASTLDAIEAKLRSKNS